MSVRRLPDPPIDTIGPPHGAQLVPESTLRRLIKSNQVEAPLLSLGLEVALLPILAQGIPDKSAAIVPQCCPATDLCSAFFMDQEISDQRLNLDRVFRVATRHGVRDEPSVDHGRELVQI